MKQAVVTIAIGDRYKELSNITFPSIKKYAEKIGAEFVPILEQSDFPHWEKLRIFELLIHYNRIIYVDADIIIREDCPNLFDIVPEKKLGIFNEGRFASREDSLIEACKEYNKPIPKNNGEYYNTGVMVISRKHRPLFKYPQKLASLGMFEQGYLNMLILSDLEIERDIEELDYKFNRMTLFDGHCGIHRLDSYIVHYAGAPPQMDLIGLIKSDLQVWKEKSPDFEFERNVIIHISGGLGDQLETEPVARYAIENFFKDIKTNYMIVSDWPRLFQHLNIECMTKDEFDKIPKFDTPYKVLKTIPAPDESPIWKIWSHVCGHTVDYASVSALHKTIPDENKSIKLVPTIEGLVESMDIAGSSLNDLVLVHPGRGWASKTFPAEWWENLIKELLSKGLKVGVIGKHINDEQGYVNINVPDGVIDFRDLLSLDGLISLIATAKVVISNDSSPIHIAGAFDNFIILIATCKHPDHILPYRNGSKYYKSFAFAKKLTVDDWDISPTRIFKESADVVKGDILDYLPDIKDVVDKAYEYHSYYASLNNRNQIEKFLLSDSKYNTKMEFDERYDEDVAYAINKYLKDGDNAIDVGANFGKFTEQMAKITKGNIFAFEPEIKAFNKLLTNISEYNNITAYNLVVGDENKNVELYYNLDNDGGHSLWDPALHAFNFLTRAHERIKEECNMVTLDDFHMNYEDEKYKPSLIKIDTEGCELKILKGAINLLKTYKPVVICEINFVALEAMGTNEEELYEFMSSLGYNAYTLPDEKEIMLSKKNRTNLVYNILFKHGGSE